MFCSNYVIVTQPGAPHECIIMVQCDEVTFSELNKFQEIPGRFTRKMIDDNDRYLQRNVLRHCSMQCMAGWPQNCICANDAKGWVSIVKPNLNSFNAEPSMIDYKIPWCTQHQKEIRQYAENYISLYGRNNYWSPIHTMQNYCPEVYHRKINA